MCTTAHTWEFACVAKNNAYRMDNVCYQNFEKVSSLKIRCIVVHSNILVVLLLRSLYPAMYSISLSPWTMGYIIILLFFLS